LRNKVTVIVALVTIGMLSSFVLTWPARDVVWKGRAFLLSGKTLLAVTVIALAWTGTDAIVRGHPRYQPRSRRISFQTSILPSALTAAAWPLLAQAQSLETKAIGIVLLDGALALLIVAEYAVVDVANPWRAAVLLFLQLITYPVAALLYLAVPLAVPIKAAPLVVATGTALLALRLLVECEQPWWRLSLAGAAVGCVLGALSWLLSTRTPSLLTYVSLLAVLLYVLTGLTRHFLLCGRLDRDIIVEYLAVALVAWLLLFLAPH